MGPRPDRTWSPPGGQDWNGVLMKLTRLRLLGFKSFVEPTDFLIEPGLTGVVGPNGCGKSNLVEALRWVMGETSHKSLRAADMDDVIFSGTNNRPGRNNAEVAIQIDNRARKAPAQFNEHETLDVSRRIEREAGSTYRINGREVRARDVHILFADASTGSRSPSMVHQGRIGEIIQAKPEQRRRVLEEAAGISGLHARRHEAELRLRAAEHNLARLEDVITQLAGQIDALKRQARQAIRYRAVAERVRKAEATLFHLRWVAANAELADTPLMHHRGRTRAGRSVGEQNVHVAGAHLAAVDAIGRARIALDAARHVERLMLVELGGRLARAVVDLDRDLGVVASGPVVGAGKDHVVHVGGAQRFVRGLAHHPAQRFDQVRLAAAVRPDHAGEPRLNQEIGRLDEGLEAEQAQPREFHSDVVPVLTARRRPNSVRPRAHGRVERRVKGRRINRHNESPGAIPSTERTRYPARTGGTTHGPGSPDNRLCSSRAESG